MSADSPVRLSVTRMQRHFLWAAFAGFGTIAVLGTIAPKASCSVRVLEERKASQSARIVTEYDAKPLSGTRIEFYRDFKPIAKTDSERPQLILVSDALGQVVLPKMPPGKYHIIALAQPNLRDELLLDVSRWHFGKHQELTMYLAPSIAPPTFQQLIAAAEASSDVKRLKQLRGVVCDRSGTPVPQASVDVLFRGAKGDRYAARLHTNEAGRFAFDSLPEGAYILAISSQGFSTEFLPLTIAETASDDEVRIELTISPSSE
jgi:hypothetical protein